MDWLRRHRTNPYPTEQEKEDLAATTGLALNQINYWFTNARRRILPKWQWAASNAAQQIAAAAAAQQGPLERPAPATSVALG